MNCAADECGYDVEPDPPGCGLAFEGEWPELWDTGGHLNPILMYGTPVPRLRIPLWSDDATQRGRDDA